MQSFRLIARIIFVVSAVLAARILFGYSPFYYPDELSAYVFICGVAVLFAFPGWKGKWRVSALSLIAALIASNWTSRPRSPSEQLASVTLPKLGTDAALKPPASIPTPAPSPPKPRERKPPVEEFALPLPPGARNGPAVQYRTY